MVLPSPPLLFGYWSICLIWHRQLTIYHEKNINFVAHNFPKSFDWFYKFKVLQKEKWTFSSFKMNLIQFRIISSATIWNMVKLFVKILNSKCSCILLGAEFFWKCRENLGIHTRTIIVTEIISSGNFNSQDILKNHWGTCSWNSIIHKTRLEWKSFTST